MPTVQKILQKMHSQPNGIRFDEISKVLRHYGYTLVRQKGSHCQFYNYDTDDLITVKKESTVKRVYVEDVLFRINERKK